MHGPKWLPAVVEVIRVLLTTYGIETTNLLGAMRDRAMQTLKVLYPSIVDIGCYSHTNDYVGDNFQTPTLSDFTTSWLTLFSHSPKTRLLWKSQSDRSMSS